MEQLSQFLVLIFQLVVLIFSIMVHEISHGAVAYYLGDDTAKRMGRLTLNPLKHIDPVGSIILPLLLSIPRLFGLPTIIIGWAKPVPYDPRNLKNQKLGTGLIGLSGPGSNLILAVIFAIFTRIAADFQLNSGLIIAFQAIILINLMLAIFNLVPIPPLDGSRILFALLPRGYLGFYQFLERNSLVLILLFILLGIPYLGQLVVFVHFSLLRLVGLP